MKVGQGSARLVCEQGQRAASLCVSRTAAGWYYEVARLDRRTYGEAVSLSGYTPTWAEAYRAGMRAAERMLGEA